MSKQNKEAFYNIEKISSLGALYNMIIGERSNGKTYSCLKLIVQNYWNNKTEGAIIRRWDVDFKMGRAQTMFEPLIDNGEIAKITKGAFTSVVYYSGKWYLSNYDPQLDKQVRMDTPFCHSFALSQQEHDKSTGYPRVATIVFDEFITREAYLPDEFTLFMNTLSTIIRRRDGIVIYMLGNTVNKYCPYFNEMGIKNVANMQQGTIKIMHSRRDPETTVAIEYCGEKKARMIRSPSDKYFGFDNPKLDMITHGAWEIASYPHLPFKYKSSEVQYKYFIIFDADTLMCEIIRHGEEWITFIHRWTSPIPDDTKSIVFSTGYSSKPNWRRKINKPNDDVTKRIAWFFANDKVFYVDNEVGEIVRNYVKWCGGDIGIK